LGNGGEGEVGGSGLAGGGGPHAVAADLDLREAGGLALLEVNLGLLLALLRALKQARLRQRYQRGVDAR